MTMQWQAVDNIEPIADSTIEGIANLALFNVISGCGATYSAASMEKTIASGSATVGGVQMGVAGNNVTLESDPSNPRWTYTYINSSGVAAIVSGDPAVEPAVPELGNNTPHSLDLIQAAQTIAANVTYKIDKRVPAVPLGWNLIDTQVLSTTAASVSFQGIPSWYRAFRLTIYVVNDTNAKNVQIRLNNDSGNNYTYQYVAGNGATVNGALTSSQAQFLLTLPTTIDASGFAKFDVSIAKPLAATPAFVSWFSNVRAASTIASVGGSWNNTADLISRIDVIAGADNFAAGTTVMLEGAYFQ